MLTGLTLRNFRAFKDQSFRFRRLNIFIGKNNSGKSSALSALNLIAQTISTQELESTPLLLNGQFQNLGTYIDVVNGNNPRRKIGIDLEFDRFSVKTEYKYRSQRREIDISDFELLDRSKSVMKYTARKDSYSLSVKGRDVEKIFPSYKKRRPRFINFWPTSIVPSTQFRSFEERDTPAYKTLREADIALYTARRNLMRYFDNFDSISPFRDQPQRTYLYSGESARKVGISGSNMATMLAADASKRGGIRKDLVSNISFWFRYTGIAEGVTVQSLTPRHFEICLISNDGSKHNICDVGFGCSQVLPVLVGGLNLFDESHPGSSNKLLVVQEPEIHLHPDAQAALGSFFSNLATRGGQIFIETHSDNLVLRIARHVALGDIAPEDVAIFYVTDQGEERVSEIGIDEHGAFEPPFPNGFFPQRQAESLSLARAAMRKSSSRRTQLAFEYPEPTA
ncbi:AAA family ATPase [Allosphingosinicella indica]|uniref:Predicted ATPase n=1 Tax=Allosphingosinicella indica TaxID=941907 RepID=A0A1X7FZ86_9SPHN|nr:AAA family ATPase [Allosphingosinicella indica]SMF61379.1 Predicted ATPase [Allosphingosinicella indica]